MSRGGGGQALPTTGSVLASSYASIQDAINVVSASGGGAVWVDGAFTSSATVDVPTGVYLMGYGPHRSSITRSGSWSGPLVDMSGTATGFNNHQRRSGIYDMTISNNDAAHPILRIYYGNTMKFNNVEFTGNGNADAIDLVEVTDVSFISCRFVDVADGTTAGIAVVHIRNSAASSPAFGFGADSSNEIRFFDCTWETFKGHAVRVEAGTDNTDNPNGIYVIGCKMETQAARNSFMYFDHFTQRVFVDTVYLIASALDGGASAFPAMEDLGGSGTRSFCDVWVSSSVNNVFTCIFRVDDNNPHIYENIFHFTGNYVTAMIIVSSGNPIIRATNIYPASGTTLVSGTARFVAAETLLVSGAGKVTAADADWPLFSLPMPGSQLLVKNTSDATYRLFVRTETTTWKGVQLTL